MSQSIIIRQLGQQPYQPIWQAMQAFTEHRDPKTSDELWLLEHPSVFTQGRAGKPEHVLNPHDIPVVQIDRGGQVTYHGPGQLMAYTLLDLDRLSLNTRTFVVSLEQTLIDLLKDYDILAHGDRDAPGVYVEQAKIASIGLRVKRQCSYHGVALNVNMDLTPFSYINPCGFQGLSMTQMSELTKAVNFESVMTHFIQHFVRHFGYTSHTIIRGTTHEQI